MTNDVTVCVRVEVRATSAVLVVSLAGEMRELEEPLDPLAVMVTVTGRKTVVTLQAVALDTESKYSNIW